MKALDLAFGWLLVVGSLLHAGGSFTAYPNMPVTLLWSLSGALAGLLLASLNLLRVGRPDDRTLAWVSFAGCVGWMAVAVGLGKVTGNILGVGPLMHAISAAGLGAMSLRTAIRREEPVSGLELTFWLIVAGVLAFVFVQTAMSPGGRGLLATWIVLSVTAGMYAKRYGRSANGWALLSLLISPLLAYVSLFLLGPSGRGPAAETSLMAPPVFKVGEIVRILDGPFTNFVGTVRVVR